MITYQSARIVILPAFILAALLSVASAQTKPLEKAQEEAANIPEISVSYDETRYLTIAKLTIDSREENEPLKKSTKKFEWTLESWFSVKGIDDKPARVVLCVDTQSKRFLFQRDSDLTLTFAGEDILLGEGQRTSEFKGRARENVCWEVDKMVVEEFGSAASASFSVAGLKGDFAAASLAKFKAYYRVLTMK
ncbi:MAG: hypothetical protein IPM63_16195 [Acidobacteriota bacterium]|nr:MAG: hypothetical protein IPM63_16195 [Acidobacteriota bacterium]